VGNAFFPMQADVYAAITPAARFTLYYEQSLFNTIAATDLWAKLDFKNQSGYLRVGQFVPAYGIRHDDHTSFFRGGNSGGIVVAAEASNIQENRQGLHWEPEHNTVGGELSLNVLNFVLTGSAGKTRGDDLYSYSLNLFRPLGIGNNNALIGASYFSGSVYSQLDRYAYYGLYGGIDIGQLTLLGEVDLMDGYPQPEVIGYTAYGELSYQILQGVHAVLEYEIFDANIDFTENALVRYTIGGEIFPIPYVEFKPQVRIIDPTANTGFSRTEILFQTHLWF
jgi:hypothetical protein